MAVQKKTVTREEFWHFINLPENRDKFFERHDGEIVAVLPASPFPSLVAGLIVTAFNVFLRGKDLGYVTGADGGYEIGDDDTFAPDVAFISKSRLGNLPREGFALIAPDLAVEVKSPTDSKRAMRRKAEKYLAAGTRIVWLVFPDEQQVEVYETDQDVVTVDVDGTLDGGDVLPEFKLPVREIFGG